jgi:hypothetical protein
MATMKGRVTNAFDALQRLRQRGYEFTSGIDREGMECWVSRAPVIPSSSAWGIITAKTYNRGELIAFANKVG